MSMLYTYGMIRVFYNAGTDYIDSFIPFVLNVISDNNKYKHLDVKNKINQEYGLVIPEYSLDVIINRAHKKQYLMRTGKTVMILEEGKKLWESFSSDRETVRRINELVVDSHKYITSKKIEISEADVYKYLFAFIKDNLKSFDIFLSDKSPENGVLVNQFPRSLDQAMVEYFLNIEKQKPTLFNTLQDVIAGSIISVSLYSQNLSELGRKFEPIIAYLDTNILFSLLGLHSDEQCRPVAELYSLMNETGVFRYKVFDFTLDEMRSVLKNYKSNEHVYLSFIQTDSIYSSLKRKGWTSADVVGYIAKLEEVLYSKNIQIATTGINLEEYVVPEEIKTELLSYKEYKTMKGISHDVLAIEKISKLRSVRTTTIEKSKAIFLTSDIKLAKYNYNKSHKASGTISEVISDKLLTNIIWLKKPRQSQNLPITAIISAFRSGKFINHNVWDKFIERLKELRRDKKIEDSDISALIYDNHFHEIMYEIRNDTGKIDDNFILANVEEARNRYIKEKKNMLARDIEKEKQFESEMSLKLTEIEEMQSDLMKTEMEREEIASKKDEIVNAVLVVIESKKASHSKRSLIISKTCVWTIKLLLLWLMYKTFEIVNAYFNTHWSAVEPTYTAIQLFIPIAIWILIGMLPSSKVVFKKMQDYIYNKLYIANLRQDKQLLELEHKI